MIDEMANKITDMIMYGAPKDEIKKEVEKSADYIDSQRKTKNRNE